MDKTNHKSVEKSTFRRIADALFCGISASVLITVIWFLFTKSNKKAGVSILLTLLVVLVLGILIEFQQKNGLRL